MPGRSRTQRNRTRRNRTRRNRTQRNRSRRNLHKTMRRKKNIKTNKFRNKRIVKTKRIKGGAGVPPPITGGGPMPTGLRSTYSNTIDGNHVNGPAQDYGLSVSDQGYQMYFLPGLPERYHSFLDGGEGIKDYNRDEVDRRTKLYQSIKPIDKRNLKYWWNMANKEGVSNRLLKQVIGAFKLSDNREKEKHIIVAVIELIIDIMDIYQDNFRESNELPESYRVFYNVTHL